MVASSSDGNFALHKISLRFVDARVEQAFVESRREQIVRNMRVTCLVSAFVCLVGILGIIALGDPLNKFGNFYVGVVMFVFCVIFAIVLRPGLSKRCGTAFVEWGAFTIITIVLLITFLMQPWYLAKLAGLTPQARGHSLLLSLDAIITVVHLYIPIRWCVMIFIEVICLLLYLIPSLLFGSPAAPGGWIIDTCFFFILVVLASIGKRSQEHDARASFSGVIKERTLRCQAEFNLRKIESQKKSKSSTSTVNSESAFEQLGMTGDLVRDVQAVVALGKQERWILMREGVDMTGSELVGQGGFGTVVTARLHGTPVVMKIPLQSMGAWAGKDACNLKVLGNEIRLLRRLRHPNIVLFHGAIFIEPNDMSGATEWQLGLVVEYVDGLVLGRPITRATLRVCDFVNVAIGVCRGLRYMHALDPSIIHGDLNPNNIMVVPYQPSARAKIIDFGLSHVLGKGNGYKGGTKGWMPPERITDPRMTPTKSMDVFGLGSILYYMEVGRPAMDTDLDLRDVLRCDSHMQLPWPVETRTIFQSAARDAAHACLSIQPEGRVESLLPLQEHLEATQSVDTSMSNDGGSVSSPPQQLTGSDVALPSSSVTAAAPSKLSIRL
eukprot:TRINITY_DN13660_c0_g1_i4.p1 TRINITY_DN13660_c0_g1~~TRINITY_DN13660_c0_g1_i4.p1  ORF type:complete len:609 (+),score=53.20 TRINITY_DN13660_c0_g1_i4:43-1869(+)